MPAVPVQTYNKITLLLRHHSNNIVSDWLLEYVVEFHHQQGHLLKRFIKLEDIMEHSLTFIVIPIHTPPRRSCKEGRGILDMQLNTLTSAPNQIGPAKEEGKERRERGGEEEEGGKEEKGRFNFKLGMYTKLTACTHCMRMWVRVCVYLSTTVRERNGPHGSLVHPVGPRQQSSYNNKI